MAKLTLEQRRELRRLGETAESALALFLRRSGLYAVRLLPVSGRYGIKPSKPHYDIDMIAWEYNPVPKLYAIQLHKWTRLSRHKPEARRWLRLVKNKLPVHVIPLIFFRLDHGYIAYFLADNSAFLPDLPSVKYIPLCDALL